MRHRTWFAVFAVVAMFLVSCGAQEEAQVPAPEAEAVAEPSEERASELVQPSNWWDILPRPVYASLKQVGIYQDWFEVYELLEGTYAIYEPYQFEEAISYLVLGDDRGVIIDAGTGIGNLRQVVSELTDLPVSVVCTHEHYDHVGGAHWFDEVAIYNHPDAIGRLNAGRDNASLRRYVTESYLWKPLPTEFNPDTWTIPSVEPTALLEDDDVIDLGGRSLRVVYTPGHSPGSVCLLDSENRILFTGDHFFPGPLYAHADDVNIDQYIASNQRLSDLVSEYDHVLSGHNDPWVDSEVIPRVGDAFETIFSAGGEFSEDSGLRRYRFDGFDVLIRTETIEVRTAQ